MKKRTKFILLYFLCFFTLSVLSVHFFDTSTSYEMLSYVIWGNVIYILVGFYIWVIIDKIAEKSTGGSPRFLIRFGLGLAFLYALGLLAGGNFILLSLIRFDTESGAFWVSLSIHCIYLISFAIASICFIQTDEKTSDLTLN